MVGQWSLTTIEVPVVRAFGLRSALGVAVAHLFTFLLLPPWLRQTGASVHACQQASAPGGFWLRAMQRHRARWALLFGAVSAFGVAGLGQLRADNDPLRLLPAGEQTRIDHDRMAARIGGVETSHLLIGPRSPATEPARLLPLIADVRQLPGIAGVAGPVLRDAEGWLAVPLLREPDGSATRADLYDAIETTAAPLGCDGVAPAGAAVLIARDPDRLLASLRHSLVPSLGLLLLGMAFGLRSWRLALCGMLPNLQPSLWLYGSISWSGRAVSVATAMIGCTMLGLIHDNTLHLLHLYCQRQIAGDDRHAALGRAFDRCGRPMTLSCGVLMLGFGAAAVSKLETTVVFALPAAATIAAAWLCTSVALPLLVLGAGRASPILPTLPAG